MKYILSLLILFFLYGQIKSQKTILLGPEVQARYYRFYESPGIEWLNSGTFRPAAGARMTIPVKPDWRLSVGLQVSFAGQPVYGSLNEFTFARIPLLIQWQKSLKKEGRWYYFLRTGATGEYLARVVHRENNVSVKITDYTSPFFVSATLETGISHRQPSGSEWVLLAGSDWGFYGDIPAYPDGNRGPIFRTSAFFISATWLFELL
ncbi:MAG: hypothetical protein SF052_00290 [Bacteroidia bacterium]|nr:hypothetical protein [Bacteroidia bacterium]